jgi:NAD-dependent SIR2 family protein deacetylase
MWFLGAGASAAAGIPTAFNLIWDFKRTLYCADQRVSVRACSDLGDAALRTRLQQYFDAVGGFPSENAEDEYAYYFETAYPAEADRRRYLERQMSGASPSYGHMVLAALLKLDKARVVWTTNFDRMVEDAAVILLGSSSRLVTATLDTPELADQAMNEGRWPLLIKLHGDFQSRRLKNITSELRTQDAKLRRALVEACKRCGLAVIGYSGRDHSVMDALEEAIDSGRGYPFGLFWFQRSGTPYQRVSDLITKASAAGIEANIIHLETFDELLADILLLLPDVPPEIVEHLNKRTRRVSDAPIPDVGGSWPVLRLNALPVLSSPTVCRRVVCKIGGVREVREAIAQSGAEVLASRRQVGIIAFGSDSEVRRAFARYDITEFGLHSIEEHRLRYESAELGLLYDALYRALARERSVKVVRKGSSYIASVDPAGTNADEFQALRQVTNSLTGVVPCTNLPWAEALRIRLEYRLDRLWLLILPTIWVERTDDKLLLKQTKEFIRRRLAGRYNNQWNQFIDAWAHVILNGTQESELRAFGIGDGIDASFTISRITAFSRREVVQ